jgi:hypothetical protein
MHDCGRAQEWFGINFFSPRNLPPISMYLFTDTVVSIAARPQNFNVQALSGPAIERDHRYYDLDYASRLMTEIFLFQTNDLELILLNRAFDIYYGSLPGAHRFMPPALWIGRLTFTSGLYLGSIDSHHLFFRSNGSVLLRTIRRLIFLSDDRTVEIYFGRSNGPKLLRDFITLASPLSYMCEMLRLMHLDLIRWLLVL